MSTFEKTSTRLRWRRSRLVKDRVLLAIIAFIVAMGLILLGAYLRHGTAMNGANDLPALSAGLGVSVLQDSPVRLGVGAPGTAQNAVESILSDSPVSSPALGRGQALQRLATAVAKGFPASAQPFISNFSGRPGLVTTGAGLLLLRESDTARHVAQAAPGSFSSGRSHA